MVSWAALRLVSCWLSGVETVLAAVRLAGRSPVWVRPGSMPWGLSIAANPLPPPPPGFSGDKDWPWMAGTHRSRHWSTVPVGPLTLSRWPLGNRAGTGRGSDPAGNVRLKLKQESRSFSPDFERMDGCPRLDQTTALFQNPGQKAGRRQGGDGVREEPGGSGSPLFQARVCL